MSGSELSGRKMSGRETLWNRPARHIIEAWNIAAAYKTLKLRQKILKIGLLKNIGAPEK